MKLGNISQTIVPVPKFYIENANKGNDIFNVVKSTLNIARNHKRNHS